MEPNQNTESVPAAKPLNLLETTERAFALAGKGALSIIELFNAAGELTASQLPDIAIQLYELWIKSTQSPIAYAAYFNLVVLLSNNNDQAGAEQGYLKAVSLNPNFVEGH